jgi:O-antigen ligase
VTSLYGVLTFFLQGGPELDVRIRGFHGFYLTNAGLLLLCTFPAVLYASCPGIAASHRWGAGIAGGAILTAQFLGALPGAWLGTAVGLLHLSLVRRYAAGGFVLLAGTLALLFAPPILRDKAVDLLDPDSPGNLDRVEVWRNGVELFLQDPWTGWGLADLRDEYARVKSPGEPPEGHMHSVPIQVAASMGVPGLLAFGWLIVTLFRVLARARRETFGFLRRTVDAAEAGLVAFLAAGLVEWNLGDSEILALLGFLIGVAIAAGRLAPLADPAQGGIGRPRGEASA